MLVLCKLLEPGQGARRRTDCASHCRCEHPVVPQVPLVNNETQPVRFAPQYKTRYPFYRWVIVVRVCCCVCVWVGGMQVSFLRAPCPGSRSSTSVLCSPLHQEHVTYQGSKRLFLRAGVHVSECVCVGRWVHVCVCVCVWVGTCVCLSGWVGTCVCV